MHYVHVIMLRSACCACKASVFVYCGYALSGAVILTNTMYNNDTNEKFIIIMSIIGNDR